MTWRYVELLAIGAAVTAGVSIVAILLGLGLGVLVCSASLARSGAVRAAGRLYISFFRGSPLLVQLLMIYYLLPAAGINVPSLVAAVLGLALCTAAYQAENLRGGFLSVAPGLIEAAQMLGMAPWRILLRIRLPIALRLTLPAVLNEAIMILKASSLVSVVGVEELTRSAQNLATSTYRPIPIYAAAGAFYLILNRLLAGGGGVLRRMLG
ncbi:MAG: amino acid ABC transporter permease [Alphaproteobacteria bacterium]|nr:amino acid ABC transporter permease [Alphaproteobacteria bacterium]